MVVICTKDIYVYCIVHPNTRFIFPMCSKRKRAWVRDNTDLPSHLYPSRDQCCKQERLGGSRKWGQLGASLEQWELKKQEPKNQLI